MSTYRCENTALLWVTILMKDAHVFCSSSETVETPGGSWIRPPPLAPIFNNWLTRLKIRDPAMKITILCHNKSEHWILQSASEKMQMKLLSVITFVISSDYIDNLVIFWGINHKFVIRLIFVQVATLGKNMNTHEWVYTQGDLPCVQKWLGLWVATHVPHSSWGSHVHINTSEPLRRPVHLPSASLRQIPWW